MEQQKPKYKNNTKEERELAKQVILMELADIVKNPKTISKDSTITLNNGLKMPIFGLGTYHIHGEALNNSVKSALLDNGYNMLDTAYYYKNDQDLGKALENNKIKREDVFITTKYMMIEDYSPSQFLKDTLQNLQLDYVDLLLIHFPNEDSGSHVSDADKSLWKKTVVPGKKRLATWKEFIELNKEGKCKSIGVSNFQVRHLKQLIENSDVVPAVNQIECHPFLQQRQIHEFCINNGIHMTAHCSLTRTKKFDNETIVQIARKHKKSSAQILIRWPIQKGIVVIPKSCNPDRIRQNSDIFDFILDDEDMKKLYSLEEDFNVSPSTLDSRKCL